MRLEEAVRREIADAQAQYAYQSEVPDDYWKTEEEFLRDGGGDCEDWVAFVIVRAVRRALEADEQIAMVIGTITQGHAWGELGDRRLWFEPTPGWPLTIGEPWRFARTPRYSRRFVPGVGFVESEVYHHA